MILGRFFFQMINRQIPHVQRFVSEFLELQKYSKFTDCYRLFCFLTDSVFRVLFAYFDESMASIGGMNHREVGIQ